MCCFVAISKNVTSNTIYVEEATYRLLAAGAVGTGASLSVPRPWTGFVEVPEHALMVSFARTTGAVQLV